MKADILPLQALDMAAWEARREGAADLTGLVHHADHGSNYLSIVYTDRIGELGAKPSTGTVGDSFDNALAEAVNGLYKTELIRRRGPWRTIEQVELATLEYVWWWNNQRLHGELDMRTPPRSRRRTTLPKNQPSQHSLAKGTHRNETQCDSPSHCMPRGRFGRSAGRNVSRGRRSPARTSAERTHHVESPHRRWRHRQDGQSVCRALVRGGSRAATDRISRS